MTITNGLRAFLNIYRKRIDVWRVGQVNTLYIDPLLSSPSLKALEGCGEMAPGLVSPKLRRESARTCRNAPHYTPSAIPHTPSASLPQHVAFFHTQACHCSVFDSTGRYTFTLDR